MVWRLGSRGLGAIANPQTRSLHSRRLAISDLRGRPSPRDTTGRSRLLPMSRRPSSWCVRAGAGAWCVRAGAGAWCPVRWLSPPSHAGPGIQAVARRQGRAAHPAPIRLVPADGSSHSGAGPVRAVPARAGGHGTGHRAGAQRVQGAADARGCHALLQARASLVAVFIFGLGDGGNGGARGE